MPYGSGKYTYELADGWCKFPMGHEMPDVGGVAVDAQDRVYVLNRGPHPVNVFDRNGNFLTSWGEGFFKRAHGCFIGPDGSVYCTDDGSHCVGKFTPEGKLLMVLGRKDQPSDTGYAQQTDLYLRLASIKRGGLPFNRPTGVGLSSSGDIYVTDGYGNARVHKFTPDGTLVFAWGEPGYAPGQFRLPHQIWIDKKDRVWVADRENNRIQIFTAHGDLLNVWPELHRPTSIVIDDKERVYVSELRQRVSIFTIDGTLLARWDSEGQGPDTALFLAPHAIAVDSHGDIYVGEVSMTGFGVDRGPRAVQKFVRKS